jgi:Xaa-Pro aminopeptidase
VKLKIKKLQKKLVYKNLDAFLVTDPLNIRYLSGFWGINPTEREALLLITPKEAFLLISALYLEQALALKPDFKIAEVKRERPFGKVLKELTEKVKTKRLGFESGNLTFAEQQGLKKEIKRVKFLTTTEFVETFRLIKDSNEISALQKAAHLADEAFKHIERFIKPGLTEKEVGLELEVYIRKRSEDVSFKPIIASGSNSSLPHHTFSSKRIKAQEMILLDFGAKVNGYCSDMTRMIFLGKSTKEQEQIYQTVLSAQREALKNIKAGITGHQADSVARDIIKKAGFGDNFTHRLGHGVGLGIHEKPYLGEESHDILKSGMVFTIEPGIYLPGWGGIRIEDTVLLKNGEIEVLTKSPKEITII